jgi:aryl-alcohol dehydrogenase-like predicted oxidoreductase
MTPFVASASADAASSCTGSHAIHPVASLQSEFSLWERGPVDNGVLDWCRAHGAAFIPFSPLGRGFLTGQVARETITDGDLAELDALPEPAGARYRV